MSVEFVAAAELAGLPGLPRTFSATLRWLRKNNVTSREVPGRGGPGGKRTEYSVAELPIETRAALAARLLNGVRAQGAASGGNADAARQGAAAGAKVALGASLAERAIESVRIESLKTGLRVHSALRGRAEQRMDAKLAILAERERFQRAGSLSIKASEFHFAAAYSKGAVSVEPWVRARYARVSPSTLAGWRRAVKSGHIHSLAGLYGNRKDDGKIDRQPALRKYVIAFLVEYPTARATQVEKGIKANFRGEAIDLPALRSIERWIAAWRRDNAQALMALANPDAWRSKHMVAFGSRSEAIVRLNQLWELDSSPADVMLTDGRHSIIGGIDVYSRRARLLVSKTSTAVGVAALNRRMLIDLGVPEVEKTDNGEEFKGTHMTRVLAALGVEHVLCPRFQADHKPHIERFFGTFTRDLVELLPGFIGHNVAERSAIESRQSFADRLMTRGEVIEVKMSAADFQEFCDNWIDSVYSRNAHRGLDGKSPDEMAASWPHPVRRIADERALDVLLAPAAGDNGWRTVQKKGLLIDGAWFIAPDLGSAPGARVGERVLCLELPDLGRVVVQGGADMQFICIAECPERTGVSRREIALLAKRNQVVREQENRRALRALAKQENTDQVVEQYLTMRAEEAGKLAFLPKPALAHASAGLAAAAGAVAELHRPARSTAELMSDDQARAERARIEQAIPAGHDNELARRRAGDETQPVFENRYERVTWLLTKAKVRALTNEEQEFLGAYKREQPTSYRQLLDMVDEQFATRPIESGGAETA